MSSEAKYTPGPWLIADDGLLVYALHHNGDYRKGQPVLVNRMSARVEPCNHQGGTVDEGLANARLIAAAPELLECLKTARHQLKTLGTPDDGINNFIIAAIDGAIVKAAGVQK